MASYSGEEKSWGVGGEGLVYTGPVERRDGGGRGDTYIVGVVS